MVWGVRRRKPESELIVLIFFLKKKKMIAIRKRTANVWQNERKSNCAVCVCVILFSLFPTIDVRLKTINY